MDTDRPLVLVTVGTDHHPFDRLISWVDRWPARSMATLVVQHGSARPIPGVRGSAILDPSTMQLLLQSADVVVCAGGPSTVMDARRHGRRPIVVPRLGSLGEHVDDHQQSFAHHLAKHELAIVADDPAALYLQLDRAFIDPDAHRIPPCDLEPPGIRRVGEMIDALVRGRS